MPGLAVGLDLNIVYSAANPLLLEQELGITGTVASGQELGPVLVEVAEGGLYLKHVGFIGLKL